MFKKFKFNNTTPTVITGVVAEKQQKVQTVHEVIEEIHETFYTEVDRLLEEAKISKTVETTKQDLIDKSKRLKDLGFTNTKEVLEANKEIKRLEELQLENENKATLVSAINYFTSKYPYYKFITEDSVKKICEKYNLVYGEIKHYLGTVPDKNLKHIEDFKIQETDACFIKLTFYGFSGPSDRSYVGFNTYTKMNMGEIDIDPFTLYRQQCKKASLEIVAPKKDFKMTGMEVKDNKISKIEIPDPIVLQPVLFNGKKHYLIVTAWGLEAGDELVVNANHN